MRKFFLIFFFFFVFCPLAYAGYLAQVDRDKINVRVDSTVMSPSLGYLEKGENVEIIEEKFDWCKVILPKRFSCYISSRFLKKIDENKFEVIADDLNLRNEPSLTSFVIGKIKKGTVLLARAKNNGWFKVRGYPYISGWVNKSFLKTMEPAIQAEGKIFIYNKKDCEANYILKNNEKEYLLNIRSKGNKKFLNKKVRAEGKKVKNECTYILVQKLFFVR